MAKTISVQMSPADFVTLESVLDLAGQFLSDWVDSVNDGESNDGKDLAEKLAEYRDMCEKFGVTAWDVEF